jgi:hypothetical protein
MIYVIQYVLISDDRNVFFDMMFSLRFILLVYIQKSDDCESNCRKKCLRERRYYKARPDYE